jgi:LysR family transcriptional regulator, nitrogen assimilation regulatory protein
MLNRHSCKEEESLEKAVSWVPNGKSNLSENSGLSMELRQLKYFLAAVDCGSLTDASKRIFVAQSALSRQIAGLEAELKVRLLRRGGRGVSPTDEGRAFYSFARGIVDQIREVKQVRVLAAFPHSERLVLSISPTVPDVLTQALWPVLEQFRDWSGIELIESNNSEIAQRLLEGSVHLGLHTSPLAASIRNFTPLVEEELMLMEGSPVDRCDDGPIEMSALEKLTLLVPPPSNASCTIGVVESALTTMGRSALRDVLRMGSLGLLMSALRARVGAAILPQSLVSQDILTGRVHARAIAGSPMRRVGVLQSPTAGRGSLQKLVLRAIHDAVKNLVLSGAWRHARWLPTSEVGNWHSVTRLRSEGTEHE